MCPLYQCLLYILHSNIILIVESNGLVSIYLCNDSCNGPYFTVFVDADTGLEAIGFPDNIGIAADGNANSDNATASEMTDCSEGEPASGTIGETLINNAMPTTRLVQ